MSRAWWIALLLVPGGLLVAPALWFILRTRERNRVQILHPSIEVVDLVAARERLRDGDWWNE